MFKFEKIEFTISQHFATLLEYGDCPQTGEEEFQQFESWVSSKTVNTKGHWVILDTSENYAKCEVTGLQSNCMIVAYMVLVKE